MSNELIEKLAKEHGHKYRQFGDAFYTYTFTIKQLEAMCKAYHAQECAGWQLVPIEPTDDMWQTAFELYDKQYHQDQMQSVIICIQEIYKAMLASAPKKGE